MTTLLILLGALVVLMAALYLAACAGADRWLPLREWLARTSCSHTHGRLVEMGLDGVKGPGLRDEMCKTCACQPGSVPNGCLQTQMDFLKAAAEGTPFRCHAPLDGKLCAGWVRARAELAANPLPPQAMALIAKWDYSPPDEESPNAEVSGPNRPA